MNDILDYLKKPSSEVKDMMIKADNDGDTERYTMLSMVYNSHKKSMKEIMQTINYNKDKGDEKKVEKWETILKLKKLCLSKHKPKRPIFEDMLKYDNVKVFFWQGERYIYVLYGNKIGRYRLKLGGRGRETSDDWDKIIKTQQYKYLTLLGFKTKNGRTYTYDNGVISIWINMYRSVIKKLKVNNWLCRHFTFIPNKQSVRILLRKGLNFEDIRAYRNMECMTDKENEKLMKRITKTF